MNESGVEFIFDTAARQAALHSPQDAADFARRLQQLPAPGLRVLAQRAASLCAGNDLAPWPSQQCPVVDLLQELARHLLQLCLLLQQHCQVRDMHHRRHPAAACCDALPGSCRGHHSRAACSSSVDFVAAVKLGCLHVPACPAGAAPSPVSWVFRPDQVAPPCSTRGTPKLNHYILPDSLRSYSGQYARSRSLTPQPAQGGGPSAGLQQHGRQQPAAWAPSPDAAASTASRASGPPSAGPPSAGPPSAGPSAPRRHLGLLKGLQLSTLSPWAVSSRALCTRAGRVDCSRTLREHSLRLGLLGLNMLSRPRAAISRALCITVGAASGSRTLNTRARGACSSISESLRSSTGQAPRGKQAGATTWSPPVVCGKAAGVRSHNKHLPGASALSTCQGLNGVPLMPQDSRLQAPH